MINLITTAYPYVITDITREAGESHAEAVQDKFIQPTVYDTISEADQNSIILKTNCKQDHDIYPAYYFQTETSIEKKNKDFAHMLKTNNWNIRLDTTTELSCILNTHHAMDNVQCNIGIMKQPLL